MQADTIKRLRALSAEIGPEQWEAIGWHVRTTFNGSGGWLIADCSGVTITSGNTVAMFIAALNNALPELLAIAEGAEADRVDAVGELQSVEHSMKAGGQALVTYRVLDTNYHAPMRVRIVSLDAALAGAVTQGEGS